MLFLLKNGVSYPMLESHPYIVAPSDDAQIWRYLDIGKLLYLLSSKTLYLCRLDHFRDPWEGTWPTSYIEALGPWPPGKSIKDMTEETRASFYVSCWHASNTESAALWDLYARDSGIAIQSSIGALKKSIMDSKKYYLGKVMYFDYDTEPAIPLNMLIPPFLKRMSFSHESEVRVLTWALGNFCSEGKPIEEVENTFLKIDPAVLIQKLYVSPTSPEWLVPVLIDVCARFEISAEVHRSPLYDSRVY